MLLKLIILDDDELTKVEGCAAISMLVAAPVN